MSLERIYSFVTRSFLFALVITLIYVVINFIFFKKNTKKDKFPLKVVLVFYLSSLFEITAIRGINNLLSFNIEYSFSGNWQLIPIYYTLTEIKRGVWDFIYPVFGNIFWFVPFGFLLPLIYKRLRNFKVMLAITLIASLSIEFIQWFLNTGISDIDDIIFNLIGGVLGYFLAIKMIKER